MCVYMDISAWLTSKGIMLQIYVRNNFLTQPVLKLSDGFKTGQLAFRQASQIDHPATSQARFKVSMADGDMASYSETEAVDSIALTLWLSIGCLTHTCIAYRAKEVVGPVQVWPYITH